MADVGNREEDMFRNESEPWLLHRSLLASAKRLRCVGLAVVICGMLALPGCGSSTLDRIRKSGTDPDPEPEPAMSVSQFGIKWGFDKVYPTGRFANGDYWVIGPVKIVGISPKSQEVDGRTKHGSMVNPTTEPRIQGYDLRHRAPFSRRRRRVASGVRVCDRKRGPPVREDGNERQAEAPGHAGPRASGF